MAFSRSENKRVTSTTASAGQCGVAVLEELLLARRGRQLAAGLNVAAGGVRGLVEAHRLAGVELKPNQERQLPWRRRGAGGRAAVRLIHAWGTPCSVKGC